MPSTPYGGPATTDPRISAVLNRSKKMTNVFIARCARRKDRVVRWYG
jgi:hypothetical protein